MGILQSSRRLGLRLAALIGLWVCFSNAFAPRNGRRSSSPLFAPAFKTTLPPRPTLHLEMSKRRVPYISTSSKPSIWKRIQRRFDVLQSAGFDRDEVQTSGIVKRIKDLHNPITYLVVALLAGLRWDWCFRNPYYWFGVAFCIKWYRARYVFKIPVWDRQPNWNNIITSKEQEKDLKAFTCKKCGSTIFIAKTREFFFEGDTGIGGLGCFSCGAKGKENFVMDRERILEDVADMDDYFEYERPLDFVSAAERRKILKETEGDEEKANQLLVERAGGEAGAATEATAAVEEPARPLDETVVEETVDIVIDEAGDLEEDVEVVSETETIEAEDVDVAPKSDSTTSDLPYSPPKVEAPDDEDEDNDDLDIFDMDDF